MSSRVRRGYAARMSASVAPSGRAGWAATFDDAVAEYMTAVLESGVPDLLLRALGDIARVRGMAKVARALGLGLSARVA